jgi:CBS domain-containing protein
LPGNIDLQELTMQMISEVMTRDVRAVSPQESVQRAAQLMDELDVGALPVCEGERLVGMVTDRDIALRSTAAGKSPQEAHVDEVMSTDVRWCFEDQPLDDVMIQMSDSQVRRIPVLSHDKEQRLVGIVSLGDVATRTPAGLQKRDVEDTVEMVSSPTSVHGSPAAHLAGRTGEVGAPAGETGIGAAGASGNPDVASGAGPDGSTRGQTGDARQTSGVGGKDLGGDGQLPL